MLADRCVPGPDSAAHGAGSHVKNPESAAQSFFGHILVPYGIAGFAKRFISVAYGAGVRAGDRVRYPEGVAALDIRGNLVASSYGVAVFSKDLVSRAGSVAAFSFLGDRIFPAESGSIFAVDHVLVTHSAAGSADSLAVDADRQRILPHGAVVAVVAASLSLIALDTIVMD